MAGIWAIGYAMVASAMTYNDFKAALSSAEEGDTVYLENDVEYDSALPAIAKRVTITSPAGQTNMLLRAKNYSGNLLTISDANADVSLQDIIIDGNKQNGQSARFIAVQGGQLSLKAGTTIRNYDVSYRPGGINVCTNGIIKIQDGATIRDCDYSYYGFILLGSRATGRYREDGLLIMEGGLITGCHDRYIPDKGEENVPDCGGVIYLYPAEKEGEKNDTLFKMSGGVISNNVSDHACAGVCVLCGDMELSGTAQIIDNHGGMVNDIYVRRGKITLLDHFRGRATLYPLKVEEPLHSSSSYQVNGISCGLIKGFDGAANIANQLWPSYAMCNDYSKEYAAFWWEPLAAVVDDEGYTDIAKARRALKDGSVMTLMNDCNYRASGVFLNISNNWSVTVKGSSDWMVKYVRPYAAASFASVSTNAALRIENLLIDGRGDCPEVVTNASTQAVTTNNFYSMFSMQEGARLTLGSGTVVSNLMRHLTPVMVTMNASGQVLTIEDGATITSCYDTETSAYGTLIRVGSSNTAFDPPPRLEMTGGLITNCWSSGTLAASSGYGGMIYLQGGIFEMSGGVIAGNRAGDANAGTCAGVQLYKGNMNISGSARIENNTGKAPDLYRSGGVLTLAGDFRGRVGISSGNQAEGQETFVNIAEGATGAWGFFPAAHGSDTSLLGTPNDAGTKVKWAVRTGAIDGVAFATDAEARILWPAEKTLTLENLPHIFSGSALALSGTITFDFATDDVLSTYTGPITFLVAEGGDFTGDWTFNVPTAPRAKWYVRKTTSDGGITSYYLEYAKKGTTLIFR